MVSFVIFQTARIAKSFKPICNLHVFDLQLNKKTGKPKKTDKKKRKTKETRIEVPKTSSLMFSNSLNYNSIPTLNSLLLCKIMPRILSVIHCVPVIMTKVVPGLESTMTLRQALVTWINATSCQV